MKIEPKIQPERISKMFRYDPETGDIWWIESGKGKIKKKPAGTVVSNGYKAVMIDGDRYYCHRIAWVLTHGLWPEDQLDHINGVKTDNRLVNLRPATNLQNGRNFKVKANNTSGTTGIVWCNQTKKWRALIKNNGKTIHLGRFVDKVDAINARKSAESSYWDGWGRECH